MSDQIKTSIRRIVTLTAAAFVGFHGQGLAAQSGKQGPGEVTEQLVYVQTKDDIGDSAALFAPSKSAAKPIAVIWI